MEEDAEGEQTDGVARPRAPMLTCADDQPSPSEAVLVRDSSPLNRREPWGQLQRLPRVPPGDRSSGFSGRRLDPRTRRRVVPPSLHSRAARIRPRYPTGSQGHEETLRFRFERRIRALDVTRGRVPPLPRGGAPPRTSPRCVRQVIADPGYFERHACTGPRRAAAPGAPSAAPSRARAKRARSAAVPARFGQTTGTECSTSDQEIDATGLEIVVAGPEIASPQQRICLIASMWSR